MKISLSWLKDWVDADMTPQEIDEVLTDTGLEVEGMETFEPVPGGLAGVVVGKVLTVESHPDADRLRVTTVDIGADEPSQIVCGAPNVAAGQSVPVATVGCVLHPAEGEPFKIKRSKIRGVESLGMICAEDELGLGDDHAGIMVLEGEPAPGTPMKDYLGWKDDIVLEIGLTPNRTDAMGHMGVARDLVAWKKVHGRTSVLKTPETAQLAGDFDVTLEVDPTGAPRYMGAVVTGILNGESPTWMKERLLALGLKPQGLIVDITNYVMHDLGTPLHAFDLRKVGEKVKVRRAHKGEKMTFLDEVERELSTDDLVIANAKEAMCLAGVFGGHDSGVKDDTREIFLEAACFDASSIRKSAKHHKLSTDASYRFERGVDPNMVELGLARAVHLLQELGGGQLQGVADEYPAKQMPRELSLRISRLNTVLGTKADASRVQEVFEALEMPTSVDGDTATVQVPLYRQDVAREIDLIEEFARIVGFDSIPLPEKMSFAPVREVSTRESDINRLVARLNGLGYQQVMNNSLVSSEDERKVGKELVHESEWVYMLNPLSAELDILRTGLIVPLVTNAAYNLNRQQERVRIFEVGKSYRKEKQGYVERELLGILSAGFNSHGYWKDEVWPSDIFDVKGQLVSLFESFGIAVDARRLNGSTIYKDAVELVHGDLVLGVVGEIQKGLLKKFDVKHTTVYGELNLDDVRELMARSVSFKEPAKTQWVRRDFSLLLDEGVEFSAIRAVALKGAPPILRKVGLFDVYEGKNLDAGKKSYAVNFMFRDENKTLKDKQVDKVMEGIRERLEKELGATLRQ